LTIDDARLFSLSLRGSDEYGNEFDEIVLFDCLAQVDVLEDWANKESLVKSG